MKRILAVAALLIAALSLTPSTRAQGHQVSLTWVLSTDDTATNCPTTGNSCTQAAYRMSGSCPATQPTATTGFTLLSGTISPTVTSFTDSTLAPGVYCYIVTFTLGVESAPSNTAGATVRPKPPTGAAAVQVAMMEVRVTDWAT